MNGYENGYDLKADLADAVAAFQRLHLALTGCSVGEYSTRMEDCEAALEAHRLNVETIRDLRERLADAEQANRMARDLLAQAREKLGAEK